MPNFRTGTGSRLLACIASALAALSVGAQSTPGRSSFDEAYVRDYSRLLTTRFYFSTKYNWLQLGAPNAAKDVVYRPNNKVNFGLGASYRAITLNIGVGIPGLNQDADKYGETRYLDAQANIHTKRWATNLFLQRFKGYYISSHTQPELGWVQSTEYPTRPDLVQFNLGASTVHIVNNDRFSYRAAFNQDAWQLRSQGSLLVGGYFTYFRMNADSSVIPDRLAAQFNDGLQLRRGGFLDIGPSVGYAYTLVLHEHYFLTGSVVLGGGLSLQRATTESPDGAEVVKNGGGLGWHGQFRAGAGYNSRRYFFGLSFNQENIGYLLDERSRFSWSVGNIRINLVKRFDLRFKPRLNPLGRVGHKVMNL